MVRRFAQVTILVASALCVAAGTARAEDGRDISVGTELMATSDVTVHRAEIVKGSRVSVTSVVRNAGRVEAADVALADGHVVKVAWATLRSFFQIVP
jgi:hypothetical protein